SRRLNGAHEDTKARRNTLVQRILRVLLGFVPSWEAGTSRRRQRGTNSSVVSRRRFVRKPRTNLREPGVEYFSAEPRAIASRTGSLRTATARMRMVRSPT